jgi:hypothetical protein
VDRSRHDCHESFELREANLGRYYARHLGLGDDTAWRASHAGPSEGPAQRHVASGVLGSGVMPEGEASQLATGMDENLDTYKAFVPTVEVKLRRSSSSCELWEPGLRGGDQLVGHRNDGVIIHPPTERVGQHRFERSVP